MPVGPAVVQRLPWLVALFHCGGSDGGGSIRRIPAKLYGFIGLKPRVVVTRSVGPVLAIFVAGRCFGEFCDDGPRNTRELLK